MPYSEPQTEGLASAGELAQARRIAIVRLSALGDVINTLPALTALRCARPQAHIGWIVETASAGLLEGHPMLDELVVLDRKAWAARLKRLRGVPRVMGEAREFSAKLRAGGFDAAIDFQGNFRSGVVSLLSGAPLRVGLARKDGKELNHLFTTRHVALPDRPVHRVERGLLLLEALGVATDEAAPVVPASDADRQRIDALVAERRLEPNGFAVIHSGTSRFGSYKKWPGARWAVVATRLAQELGLRVVLTRGPDGADEAEAVAGEAAPEAMVSPLLSLRELGELFRRCRLFLSPDTGPMHLASAVGAPVVALFGPKDPQVYGPYFSPSAIVEKEMACRPCRKRSCDDPRCMLAITPDDVMRGASRLIRDA
jgi:lipopolysaccharide heptosyltransferase I